MAYIGQNTKKPTQKDLQKFARWVLELTSNQVHDYLLEFDDYLENDAGEDYATFGEWLYSEYEREEESN